MPVPVEVVFEDGSLQRAMTNRLLDKQELVFHAKSALKEAIVDPDGELPNVYPPPDASEQEWAERISALPYTGAGAAALELYRLTAKRDVKEPGAWVRLGLSLYDGAYYTEALDAFARLESASGDSTLRFMSLVWQGHLLDLTGRRTGAMAKYKAALAVEGNPTMRHDQYDMVINKKWVQARLWTPFKR
jgi:tetratricopeptide (TPR) repeat protein